MTDFTLEQSKIPASKWSSAHLTTDRISLTMLCEVLSWYMEDDQPSNAQHHCLDTTPLDLVPPDHTMRNENMNHLTNTVRNPILSVTWLSYKINFGNFRTDLPTWNLSPTHPHIQRSWHSLQIDCNTSIWHSNHIQPSSLKNLCTQLCKHTQAPFMPQRGKPHHILTSRYPNIPWTRLLKFRGLAHRPRNHCWH